MTPTTLDFAQIRTTCPNAFSALIGWFCQGKAFQYPPKADSPQPEPGSAPIGRDWLDLRDGQLSLGDFRYAYDLNVRDLFDFFDANGIITAITPISENPVEYFWRVNLSNIKPGPCGTHPTRAAAEAAAFGAAFEKLETVRRAEILGNKSE